MAASLDLVEFVNRQYRLPRIGDSRHHGIFAAGCSRM